jgi:hypothetical protein
VKPRRPTFDPDRLDRCLRLAADVYALHEAGRAYAEPLEELSRHTGQALTVAEVRGAFGSIDSSDWARDLLLQESPIPGDIADEELIAMLEVVCAATEPEWLSGWYLRCVERATGCDELIDIIYYPRDVFEDDQHDDLSAAEILAAARARKRRVIVTAPPNNGRTGSETAG